MFEVPDVDVIMPIALFYFPLTCVVVSKVVCSLCVFLCMCLFDCVGELLLNTFSIYVSEVIVFYLKVFLGDQKTYTLIYSIHCFLVISPTTQ